MGVRSCSACPARYVSRGCTQLVMYPESPEDLGHTLPLPPTCFSALPSRLRHAGAAGAGSHPAHAHAGVRGSLPRFSGAAAGGAGQGGAGRGRRGEPWLPGPRQEQWNGRCSLSLYLQLISACLSHVCAVRCAQVGRTPSEVALEQRGSEEGEPPEAAEAAVGTGGTCVV